MVSFEVKSCLDYGFMLEVFYIITVAIAIPCHLVMEWVELNDENLKVFFIFCTMSRLFQIGVSLHGISEHLTDFKKFPPRCQRGAYIRLFI